VTPNPTQKGQREVKTLLRGAILALLFGPGSCGGTTPAAPLSQVPSAPSAAEPQKEAKDAKPPMSDWSEVEPLAANEDRRAPGRKRGTVVVTSDPDHHGDSITLRFLVNGVPIEGVFVVPGGRSYTYSLPAGAVQFESEQCSLGLQGFELRAGESIPVGCELTDDGDCCEVKIPVDEGAPAQ